MDRLRALLEAAATAYRDANYEEARELAGRACKLDRECIDAWDFHSMACQALEDTAAAEQSCRKALALARKRRAANPDDDKHALRELFLLMRLGRDSEVDSLLAWLGERHPDNASLKTIHANWRLRPR